MIWIRDFYSLFCVCKIVENFFYVIFIFKIVQMLLNIETEVFSRLHSTWKYLISSAIRLLSVCFLYLIIIAIRIKYLILLIFVECLNPLKIFPDEM